MPPKASNAKRKGASGYELPEHIDEGTIVDALGQKGLQFRFGKSIGTGGFGEIYLASKDVSRNVGDEATLAVKIEPHLNGPLFVEMNFYIRAASQDSVEEWKKSKNLKSFGMPCLRGHGSHMYNGKKYRFLVMDRFGKDLQKIFLTGKRLFTPKVTYNLALKVIDVLEFIHSKGYCHNDIKAQNMLLGFGRTKENDVYLVDFGLASKYQKDGVHFENKPDARKAHDGTIEYTSRDAHRGAHARRSDLEILGYNLVHWMSGDLPWMDVLTDCLKVEKRKNGCMLDIQAFLSTCFKTQDYPAVLEEFLNYVESLEFHVEPDYNKCRKMFETALKAAGCKLDGKIDFSTPKKAPKKVRTSSPRKRKSAVLFSDEDTADADDSGTDESFAKEKSVKKRKSPVDKARTKKAAAAVSPPVAKPRTKKVAAMSPETSVKKTTVTKAKVAMKDQECQTSPGFVKAVKAARKKKPVQNVEMDEFVKESISAAKKAVKKTPAKKSPKKSPAKKAKTENGNGEAALSNLTNLTPAMLAVMAKKAESSSAKKPRTKK